MNSREAMWFHKVRRFLQYYLLIKLLSPKKLPDHELFLFYQFKDGKELLSGFPPMHREEGVKDVVNINKIKCEPYGELADQTFSQFKKNLINYQDPRS